MKKELFALLTVILLIAGSIGNLTHLNKTANQISDHIDYCAQYCSRDDFTSANKEIMKAIQVWENAEHYTHVFIRHSEIDSISDLFYDAQSAIQSLEKHEAKCMLEKLQHHANSLVRMEKLSLGTIF